VVFANVDERIVKVLDEIDKPPASEAVVVVPGALSTVLEVCELLERRPVGADVLLWVYDVPGVPSGPVAVVLP